MVDPEAKSGVVMFANGENALDIAKPIIDDEHGFAGLCVAQVKVCVGFIGF
jgi:hypothetical protein